MGEERARDDQGSRRRRRRRTRRRWCLPPPVRREPGELLEGIHVLQEFPEGTALALWTALRDVTLWAATPEERRPELFSAGAEARRRTDEMRLDPALDASLATLALVVSHAGQASPEVVARTCLKVAHWAREQNAMGTAVSFAQAASLAWPDAPGPALEVGRLALEWGRRARAETWLRLAIGLARRAREWESYGGAYVALGEIYLRNGRPELAARYYGMAGRVSRRNRLRQVRAEALHGLMRVSMALDDLEKAEEHAERARRAYGRGHPRLPELEYDVARLRMRRGQHERALPMLQRLAAAADGDRRLSCQALLAHAAAQVGDRALYERSWSAAWDLMDGARSPAAPDALLHLGKAAARASDWLRVQQAVRAFADLPPDRRAATAAAELEKIAALARRDRT